jgi:murein DD-endopeptidase MepM/ murein hydrolase activator NlpD
MTTTALTRTAAAVLALAALGACQTPMDMDLRNLGAGFSTTEAALSATERPTPDARGVISYPTYQVAVARQGDTVGSMASRLGLGAQELADYNGLAPDASLRAEEIVALPTRVAEPAVPAGTAPPGGTLVASAAAAIDRAGPVTTTALAPAAGQAAAPAPASGVPAGVEPVRHQVARGETAYSISRLYGVPVGTIAAWNGLSADLAVREGQFLLVPPAPGAAPAAEATASAALPGEGSPTPVPPSAAAPLPEDDPEPVTAEPDPAPVPQNLGEQQTETADAQFVLPAQGPVIRAYTPGRNEGIDIGAPAGSAVRAAEAGTVAAVTTNTEGVNIVVIRHANDLLTVYTHLDGLSVAKDDAVSRGQQIGQVRAGDPAFLHFEVRRGMESQDPTSFLP